MIWKGIKLEFYRAFHNIWYVGALLAATAIALVQFFTQVMPKTQVIYSGDNLNYPHSVFNSSLMFGLGSYYLEIYYTSIVLLATVPYAASYFMDVKDGYIKNIYTRMDAAGYLVGKYLAVFVSAGSICVIPLIINTYLTAMALPSLTPEFGTFTFPLAGNKCFAVELFYSYPYIYTLLYLIIDFAITGLYGCLSLVISRIVSNRYIVMFFPFVVFLVFNTVISYTPYALLSPNYIMNPAQFVCEELTYILAGLTALFLITITGFILTGGKRHDTL